MLQARTSACLNARVLPRCTADVTRRLVTTLVVGALGFACGAGSNPPSTVLRLARPLLPASAETPFRTDVRLNEELRFYFTDEVERVSVTRESVRIVDEQGREARGRIEVEGACVRFVPVLPLASDLSDAGLLPDRRYHVELRGFPAPDGLRSVRGAPLGAGLSATFETVQSRGASARSLFEDRLQNRAGLLKLHPPLSGRAEDPYVVSTQGSLFLVSAKPIDPTSIDADDFVLQVTNKKPAVRLPLSVRLIENEPRYAARPRPAAVRARSAIPGGWDQLPRAAVLELFPLETPAPGTFCEFSLRVDAQGQLGLRDLGGEPLLRTTHALAVGVSFQEPRVEAPTDDYTEDFLRTPRGSLRAQGAVAGFDGTPVWSDTGRVEVRYPAAAGDGRDGVVTLGEREVRTDVHATRLELPAGTTCALAGGGGVCVLRAQGALRIAGTLRREGAGTDAARLRAFEPELIDDAKPSGPALTLTRWLERARTSQRRTDGLEPPPWTVLIAGGDLTIEGRIEVDGPLLLCAGGMLRIPGQVRGAEGQEFGQIWILGDGGGLAVHPPPNVVKQALAVDPPIGPNPLREPLRLCAQSQSLPQTAAEVHWLYADARGSDSSRNGAWSVHYLLASSVKSGVDPSATWVDDPALLSATGQGWSGPVVYFVELVVPVGGNWTPPFLDSLRLRWEERRGGER